MKYRRNLSYQFLVLCLFLCLHIKFASFIKYRESSVFIAGTALNIKPYLPAVIGNSYILASLFKSYSIIIYCNATDMDSLSGWLKNDSNVHVIEEKPYGPGFEQKPARLAFARNKILSAVRENIENRANRDSTFLIMMDMDEMISNVFNTSVLQTSLDNNDQWDSVSYNRKRYYDIWALRYNKFDSNVWGFGSDSSKLVKIIMNDISRVLATSDERFVPVYSAFNGLAIYKLLATDDCLYDGENREPYVVSPWGDCEHVAFHKCIREKNKGKIVIDKNFILTDASWLPPQEKKMSWVRMVVMISIFGLVLLLLVILCSYCRSSREIKDRSFDNNQKISKA